MQRSASLREFRSIMSKYTIAIDAMGGDDAPRIPVEAGVIAAKEYGVGVILVGDENSIYEELNQHSTDGLEIIVINADDVIVEGEHPALALRRKPQASIAITVGLVKQGAAHAAISMGSTGATMAASVFALGLFVDCRLNKLVKVFVMMDLKLI